MGFEDSVKVADTSEACLISNMAYGNIFLFHKFFGIIDPQRVHYITETQIRTVVDNPAQMSRAYTGVMCNRVQVYVLSEMF